MGAITGTPLYQRRMDRKLVRQAENAFLDYFDEEARPLMDPRDKLAVIHALRGLKVDQREAVKCVLTRAYEAKGADRMALYNEVAGELYVSWATLREWVRKARTLYALERGLI